MSARESTKTRVLFGRQHVDTTLIYNTWLSALINYRVIRVWLGTRRVEQLTLIYTNFCLATFNPVSPTFIYKLLYTNYSHQLSSLFESKQLSYKLLSTMQLSLTFILVWPEARKVKTTFIQTLVYQLLLTFILVWPGARKIKTTLIQTLVYQLSSLFDQEQGKSKQFSYNLVSLVSTLINSHPCLTRSKKSWSISCTNLCLPTHINTWATKVKTTLIYEPLAVSCANKIRSFFVPV